MSIQFSICKISVEMENFLQVIFSLQLLIVFRLFGLPNFPYSILFYGIIYAKAELEEEWGVSRERGPANTWYQNVTQKPWAINKPQSQRWLPGQHPVRTAGRPAPTPVPDSICRAQSQSQSTPNSAHTFSKTKTRT